MSVARSTIAVNQDVKKSIDAAQRSYEEMLTLPKGSLSQQVFLDCSAQLSLVFLQVLEAATKEAPNQPTPASLRSEAEEALDKIRSETMFRQLAATQRDMQTASENLQKTLATIGIVALVLGIAAAAAGVAVVAHRRK